VGDGPNSIAVSAEAVWVANRLGRSVTKVDPRRNVAVATIPLGFRAESIAASGGRVWVALQRA
jgi:DNA-binding beta-propeller fold protein YncE